LHIALFVCLCLGMADCAFAAATEAGVVVNMEGTLAAKGVDGTLRALANFEKVLAGDTLFTGKDSYARIKFADGGVISLQPGAQFKIENYNYDEKQPDKDKAGFNLIKGGLRAISGLIGKRGDPDSYGVKTRVATVGIRGTKYGMQFCQRDCASIPTPDGNPPENGLHLDVEEGAVVVRNAAGTQLLNAGQFGFVRDSGVAPIIISPERGIRVEIPARMGVDKVRGGSDGENACPDDASQTAPQNPDDASQTAPPNPDDAPVSK